MMRTAVVGATDGGLSSDDEVPTCPLCTEEMDATDLAVKACRCGYQVCLYCLHKIREQHNGKCPACRTPYEEEKFQMEEVDREQAAKIAKERAEAKRERERRLKQREMEKERERAAMASEQRARMNLKHVRIVQRNFVYVIGLSLNLAREECLRRNEIFGRFGRILFILVNRSTTYNPDAPGGPSLSAYVQFARDSDATQAVRLMNGEIFDGRELRLAIATTKYCDAFVKAGVPTHCGDPNCLHIHEPAPPEDVLTREEVISNQLGPPPPPHLFKNLRRERTMLVLSNGTGSPSRPTAPTSPPFPSTLQSNSSARSHGVIPPAKVANGNMVRGEEAEFDDVARTRHRDLEAEQRSDPSQGPSRLVREAPRGLPFAVDQRPNQMPWPTQMKSRFAPAPSSKSPSQQPTAAPQQPPPPGFGPRVPTTTSTWSTTTPPGFGNVPTDPSPGWSNDLQKDDELKGELSDVLDRLGKTLGIEESANSRDIWSAPAVFQSQPRVLKPDRGQSRFGFAQDIAQMPSTGYDLANGDNNVGQSNGVLPQQSPRLIQPGPEGPTLPTGLDALLESASAEINSSLPTEFSPAQEMQPTSQPPPGFGVSIDPESLLNSFKLDQSPLVQGSTGMSVDGNVEGQGNVNGGRGVMSSHMHDFNEQGYKDDARNSHGVTDANLKRLKMLGLHKNGLREDLEGSSSKQRLTRMNRKEEAAFEIHAAGRMVSSGPQGAKVKTVSEVERELEAARARETELQNRLAELQQRIRGYDSINI